LVSPTIITFALGGFRGWEKEKEKEEVLSYIWRKGRKKREEGEEGEERVTEEKRRERIERERKEKR
jgi:hypothetical protein